MTDSKTCLKTYREWWDGLPFGFRLRHTVKWRLSYLKSFLFGGPCTAEKLLLRRVAASQQAVAQRGEAQEKLADWEAAARASQEIPGDDCEVHCACAFFLKKQLEEAVLVIRKLEWSGDGVLRPECPICEGCEPHHLNRCPLGTLLEKQKCKS